MNLASILECHAHSHGDKIAIQFRQERISYEMLWRQLQGCAAHLHEHGLKPGDRVGLALREHPGHLILHYALARLGAVILPIDHRWTESEKIATARAFNARLIIVEGCEEKLPGYKTLRFDNDWPSAASSFSLPLPDTDDLPLLISLSSGTTGRPKGALVTHEQMYQRFISQWVTIGFNSQDRFLGLTPLYFGAGRSFAMAFLAAGATIIFDPPPHAPDELVEVINTSRATVTFLVPTQLRKLVPLHQAGLLLPGLKKLLVSGAALYPAEAAEVRQKVNPNLIGYYASSEGGGISVLHTDEFDEYSWSAGRATFRTEVQIVDERDIQVAPGETGRLRYRGPGVATRFIDADGNEETANTDGWFYPGDVAAKLDSGHIVLRGRDNDVINRGGVNIYPAEVEATLTQLKAVREAVVIGEPSEKFGETVTAVIATNEAISKDALSRHCREQLAPYKIPSRYIVVDELRKTSSGKPDKAALFEQFIRE